MLNTHRVLLFFLAAVFMLMASLRPGNAQVMHLEFRVDAEFGLGEFKAPDLTAQAAPGIGLVQTDYDHENAGQLTLHTTENVDLIVTLTAPEYLVQDEDSRLPLDLQMAFAHPGTAGPTDITTATHPTTTIRMHPGNKLINDMRSPPVKFETCLFLYGSVVVGDVSPGMYEGTVCLRVEYP